MHTYRPLSQKNHRIHSSLSYLTPVHTAKIALKKWSKKVLTIQPTIWACSGLAPVRARP